MRMCVCVRGMCTNVTGSHIPPWADPSSPFPLGMQKQLEPWGQGGYTLVTETPGLQLGLSPHPLSPLRELHTAGGWELASQPPGQASSCDLPRQAEARCGGWGDGFGEQLPSSKPRPLLELC